MLVDDGFFREETCTKRDRSDNGNWLLYIDIMSEKYQKNLIFPKLLKTITEMRDLLLLSRSQYLIIVYEAPSFRRYPGYLHFQILFENDYMVK